DAIGWRNEGERLMDEPTPATAETRGLLEQARAGDRQAFEQLFAQHRAYLRQSIALRLDPRVRPRVDPSDVVQETQLEAFTRLADYLERRPMPFRLWLRKTAHERLLKVHRHHAADRRNIARAATLPARSSMLLARRFLATAF